MATDTKLRFRPASDRPPGGAVLPETIDRRLDALQAKVRRAVAIVKLATERATQIDGDEVPEIVDIRQALEAAVHLLEETWPDLEQHSVMTPSSPEEMAAAGEVQP